jgi:hypothetical protein
LFDVRDSELQDDLAELPTPEVRSHGSPEGALPYRVRGLGHPPLQLSSVLDQPVVANWLRFRSLSEDEQINVKRIELKGVIASSGPRNSLKEAVFNLLPWAQDNDDRELDDLMTGA